MFRQFLTLRRLKAASAGVIAVALTATLTVSSSALSNVAPTVHSIVVTPTTLSQFGGTITITATVAHATSCKVSTTPALIGLPLRFSCSSGTFTRSFSVPANLGPAISYRVTFTANGTQSVSGYRTVHQVAVDAPVPQSWSFSASLGPVTGSPSTIACPTVTFCQIGDSAGRIFTVGATTTISRPSSQVITSISCAGSGFCFGVDGAGGATRFNGSSWSVSTSIDLAALVAVSCPTTTWCLAADANGAVSSWNGASWSTWQLVDSSAAPTAISCASATSCIVVDGAGHAIRLSGSVWSSPITVSSAGLDSVSCVSSTSCVAVDDGGGMVTLNGATWSPRVVIDPSSALISVSCSVGLHCLAVDDHANSVTLASGTWSAPTSIGFGLTEMTGVACSSSTRCAAIDSQGDLINWTSSGWGTTTPIGITLGTTSSISCASAASCVLVTSGGYVEQWNGTSWSTPANSGASNLNTVSCVTGLCVAGGDGGSYVVRHGATWSSVHHLGASTSGFAGVSCVSATFCLAGMQNGDVATYNGTSWSALTALAPTNNRGMSGVSCVTSSFCALIDHAGVEYLWFSPSHIITKHIDGLGGDLNAVSCSSTTRCMAVDNSGYVIYTHHTSAWLYTVPKQIDVNYGLSSVSCPQSFYCIATDQNGREVPWLANTWGKPVQINGAGPLAAISCTSDGVCVSADIRNNAVIGHLR